MNNNIFQHNSSCVLGVTFSLTLEKAMVGDLGKSLCLMKYWFCSLRKETLVSYYISKTEWETYMRYDMFSGFYTHMMEAF